MKNKIYKITKYPKIIKLNIRNICSAKNIVQSMKFKIVNKIK